MKRLIALSGVVLWPLLTAGACATTQGPPEYVPVSQIVTVSCIPANVPQVPQIHSDAELRALDGPSRYVVTAADRAALLAWFYPVARIIENCRTP